MFAKDQLLAMRQLTVTLPDDAPQARTTAAAQTKQSATEAQVLGGRRKTIVETIKNSDEQFRFVFLDYTGVVDTSTQGPNGTTLGRISAMLMLAGTCRQWRRVAGQTDDPVAVEVDKSLPLEFLTQAAPVDESGSKTRRRSCDEVLPDHVRSAAILMNSEDDPKRRLIARDDRFTTFKKRSEASS